MRSILLILITGILFAAVAYFCFFSIAGPALPEREVKKELLVYCGITMADPISEIARIIEKEEDCKIVVVKGGSGNLLRAIETNKVGDLYLPGCDSYIRTCEKKGLVDESVLVGHNCAALLVQKGNPKSISADLINLTKPEYYVVIGDAHSGSIGKETKKILDKRGIYSQVCQNARHLTSDSKDLVTVLKDKEADLVVNWMATSYWPENEPYVDAIEIDEEYAKPKKLVLGLLTFSHHRGIAEKFMQYASSREGKKLFRKYGLYGPDKFDK